MNRTFALYPEERHWWSMADYGAVLDVMQRLKPERVVEFGPGSSTLSLIEGGAASIDTCEDQTDWFNTYQERIARQFPTKDFPTTVTMHRYTWADPLVIPALEAKRFDLALVDGPHGTLQRPAVIAWCLARSQAVLVPTEEIAYGKGALRPHIQQLAAEFNREIEWMETGPLSGGFALIVTRAQKDLDDYNDAILIDRKLSELTGGTHRPTPPRPKRRKKNKPAQEGA